MKSLSLLLALVAAASAVASVSALPSSTAAASCPSLPVQIELHTSQQVPGAYKLQFASVDHSLEGQQADFVDMHYRINDEDSENLRVLTSAAITDESLHAKTAEVDGIILNAGDAIRAYVTYSARGFACDTPVHTFSAPEASSHATASASSFHTAAAMRAQAAYSRQYEQAVRSHQMANGAMDSGNFMIQASQASQDAQAAQAEREHDAHLGHQSEACPHMQQDILKIAGEENSYVLSFMNSNPAETLHFVDLHMTMDSRAAASGDSKEWSNLRLASSMELTLAHRVMQPGVVIAPHETLHWYWTYSTTGADGEIVQCQTDVTSTRPEEVTHELTKQQLKQLAVL